MPQTLNKALEPFLIIVGSLTVSMVLFGVFMASAGADPFEGDVLLAVNGTLMRGLELNPNMLTAKATFVREAMTEPTYRLWTINDEHPAMLRVTDGTGAKVAVEVWSVPASGLVGILLNEPPGLCIGKVLLEDGTVVLRWSERGSRQTRIR